MEDVILNLLSNAIKFTPPGGNVSVTVAQNKPGENQFPSGSVSLSIQDTGPGIPRDQLEHIFDRFYQSENSCEHHPKGSGIGLTIAKELVMLHKGKIDVHSLEKKGTEFIVRLPIVDQADSVKIFSDETIIGGGIADRIEMLDISNSETTESDEPINDEVPEKDIILVVEDNADAREYIKDSLEPLYKVASANDGPEGIQKALEIIPDLIVSDIMMPGTDGYELCRRLKTDIRTSHIPIILLTAKVSEASLVQGLETGADDYITNPYNTNILRARIRNLIQLRTHLQEIRSNELTLMPVKLTESDLDREFLEQVDDVIIKNLSEPEFNVEQLAKKLYIGSNTLYRKIQALTGDVPSHYIRTHRLRRAVALLRNNFGSVTDVAFEVGFSSRAYFTRCFKEQYHHLPSHYVQ
ncbi:MAG: response regulator, partial [bacterium]|nr:response regulator [bacterium]